MSWRVPVSTQEPIAVQFIPNAAPNQIVSRVRRFVHATAAVPVILTVPSSAMWYDINIFARVYSAGVAPVAAARVAIIPEEPNMTPGGERYECVITTVPTEDAVRQVLFTQNATNHDIYNCDGVGLFIQEVLPIPKIPMVAEMSIEFDMIGGVADYTDFLFIYNEARFTA